MPTYKLLLLSTVKEDFNGDLGQLVNRFLNDSILRDHGMEKWNEIALKGLKVEQQNKKGGKDVRT